MWSCELSISLAQEINSIVLHVHAFWLILLINLQNFFPIVHLKVISDFTKFHEVGFICILRLCDFYIPLPLRIHLHL